MPASSCCWGRILQTFRLPYEVSAATNGDAAAEVAQPELFIAPVSTRLHDRRRFGAAILVNHNADGASRATSIVDGEATTVRLGSPTIEAATTQVADLLTQIVDEPDNDGSLDSPSSVER